MKGIHSDTIKKVASLQDMVVTGSYDGLIKLADERTGAVVQEIALGTAVEDLCVLRGGRVLAALTRGRCLLWDLASLSAPLCGKTLSQKTLSCMQELEGQSLVVGGVDQHVRVWDWAKDQLRYQHKLAHPLTQLALTQNRSHLALGFSNGEVLIQSKSTATEDEPE